jgi:hypothetical protein
MFVLKSFDDCSKMTVDISPIELKNIDEKNRTDIYLSLR